MTEPAREIRTGRKPWLGGRTLGLLVFACVMVVTLCILSPSFLTKFAFTTQTRWIALYVLVAMAQAICLAVGDMNLTVGGVGSIATVVLGLLIDPTRDFHMSPLLAVPIVLLIGPITGLLHGFIITRLKIDSFIVTLSMMFVYMGLRSGISKGGSYSVPAGFTWLGQYFVLGGGPYSGGWLYNMVVITFIILGIITYMYKHTVLGRRLLATGSNSEAARLSGINTGRMVVVAHMISGTLSVTAAIMYASWNGNAAASTGDDWLIVSFAVAIIGGTGLKGSLISPLGILMGAIIYHLIRQSLSVVKVDDSYSNALVGALILLAIIVDRAREHMESMRKNV